MGLADRDYMKERYRARQGLSPEGVRWNDRKGRCELEPDYFAGAWRARIRQHYATRKRLLQAGLMSVAGTVLVVGAHKNEWLAEHLAVFFPSSAAASFPASGTVSVSPMLNMRRVKSHLTLQGSDENAIVQLIDARSGSHTLSVYIRAFERVSVPAPTGNYRVRFIHGRNWMNPRTFFGSGTAHEEVIGAMPFTQTFGHVFDLRLGPDSGLAVRRLSLKPEPLQ
ncbi:MAG: hypothetical protein B7Y45_10560 [Sphingomonas sp. 28-66-16]|nr:MAG: hypothetical protein B7Y45_10560 [Sphingomonas sp. 28-66-16]